MMRWIFRILLGIIAIIVAIVVIGLVYEAVAEASDRANFPPPGQMVDVGGHKLHIYCTGQGSPTVVLNGASVDTVSDWVWVQGEVSKLTRVCAYDRAGMGWSDPSPKAPDTEQNALELRALLQNG